MIWKRRISECQKAIYTKSRLKNKVNKNPTIINIAYKRQRNLSVSLRKKSYLNNVTKMGITTNKNFWTFIKPTLTKKGFLEKQWYYAYWRK